MKKLIFSLVLLVSTMMFATAQAPQVISANPSATGVQTVDAAKWSVALKGGLDYFNINPLGKDFKDNSSWGAGLSIENTVNPFVGYGLNLDYLNYDREKIKGATFDPTLFTSINLSNVLQPVRKSGKVNLYANFGAGASFTNFKDADFNKEGYPESGSQTSGLGTTSLAVEANLGRLLALGVEAGYRGYITPENARLNYNDAFTLMASLRFKLGNQSKPHMRELTRYEYAPIQATVTHIENPYDDSNILNRLDNLDRQTQDLQNRLKDLEDAVKNLADMPEGSTVQASFDKIEFEFDSSRLTTDSKVTLDQIASILLNNPTWNTLVVKGHTDSTGPDAYNQGLSERRAASVKDYLVGKGLNGAAISTVGYGESQPIATNNTAAGRQSNRRVEFEIAK